MALALNRDPGRLVIEILLANTSVIRDERLALANTFMWVKQQIIESEYAADVPRKGYRTVKKKMRVYLDCPFDAATLANNWRSKTDSYFEAIYELVSDSYVALASYVEMYNRRLDKKHDSDV